MIDLNNVNVIEVAKVKELKCSVALEQIRTSKTAMLAVPSHWLKPKARLDRKYLWNILNTVHPDWVAEVTRHYISRASVVRSAVSLKMS